MTRILKIIRIHKEVEHFLPQIVARIISEDISFPFSASSFYACLEILLENLKLSRYLKVGSDSQIDFPNASQFVTHRQ